MSSPAVSAHEPSGGAAYKARPSVTKFECVNGDTGRCPQGELLRVRGEGLQQADSVLLLGRDGHEDGKVARADKRSPYRVVVRVPPDAKTGPVPDQEPRHGTLAPLAPAACPRRSRPRRQPLPVAPAGEGVFPVRDKYDFGTDVNGFGGGRGHKGQDIFATCGMPLVSARSGIVTVATSEARAGNYTVITADDGTSQAYMHMLQPATVMRDQRDQRDQRVTAGQPIGQVGQSGRATGCHLHFEL